MLQGRIYECTKLVQQRFGLDDQTLRKWAKNNIVPLPVKLGNKCFYDCEAIESRILANCRGGEADKSSACEHATFR
jgi:hypothetical protein